MDKEQIIKAAKKILNESPDSAGKLAETLEFLRIYDGEKSSFFKQVQRINPLMNYSHYSILLASTLKGFISFYESGLSDGISIERRAQIDVVSDFL